MRSPSDSERGRTWDSGYHLNPDGQAAIAAAFVRWFEENLPRR